MGKTKNSLHSKNAFIASMDLLLSFIVIISIVLPVLNYASYQTISSVNDSKNSQTLSSLIQVSELFYTNLAAQKSTDSQTQKKYSHFGILSDTFNPDSPFNFSYMGLEEFSISRSPPQIKSQNQFCIKRIMQDENKTTKLFWFCARG